jgi:hypothetical protein
MNKPVFYSAFLLAALTLPAAAQIAQSKSEVSGEIVMQWTFDGPNPETSSKGNAISTWTSAAPNDASTPGVLRFATDGNAATASLGLDTSTLKKLILTVKLTDLRIATDGKTNDRVSFTFVTDAGQLILELKTYKNNQLNVDVKGPDGKLDIEILDQDKVVGQEIPFVFITIWDFENKTMSFESQGTKVIEKSMAVPGLDKVKVVNGFRPKAIINHGTYLNLDTVTISTE